VNPIGEIIALVLYSFLGLLFVRLVVDWIQFFARSWSPTGPVLVLLEAVYTVTDPPIRSFRRIFKPLRIGGVSLDLSFLAVMLVVYLLIAVNSAIWANY
jgi:YggT family protein